MDRPCFRNYASPPPHLAFSADYFSSLTIARATELTLPTIAEVGSVLSAEFSDEIPGTGASTVIVPTEVIPAYCDLKAVTANIEDAFEEGKRSVLVRFMHMGKEYIYKYHFSKLQLIRNCSNYLPAITACRRLLTHLQSPRFNLGAALETFQNSLLSAKIRGFFVSEFPLYQLACLLGESWLEEDVFNALLEFSYFYHALHTPEFPRPALPRSLLLPTSFLSDAVIAYGSQPRTYTPEITAIRHRIWSQSADTVAMSFVNGNHFTAFIYHVGRSAIEYGDSMHNPPPSYMLPILQWIFDGVAQPAIRETKIGIIAQQGNGNGEGSCGMAAYNFMELAARTRPGLRAWTGSSSSSFRDAALEDLLRFHHLAWEHGGTFLDWAVSERNKDSSMVTTLATGFNDFNVYSPLESHPMTRFHANTVLTREIIPPRRMLVPPVSDLRSMPILNEPYTSTLPLLPAFELAAKSITAPVPQRTVSSPATTFSPTRKPGKRRHRSLDGVDFTLISPVPPSSKKHAFSKGEVGSTIDSDEEVEFVDPPSKTSVSVKSEQDSSDEEVEFVDPPPHPKAEPMCIDLITPPRKPLVKKEEIINLVTPPSQPITDFSISPDRKPAAHQGYLAQHQFPSRTVEPAPGAVTVNTYFATLDEAQAAISAREERLGYTWKRSQGKPGQEGILKKKTFRCNQAEDPKEKKSMKCDPSDHRQGKSGRTGCKAHVNVNRDRSTGLWRITLVEFEHNHPPARPEGAPVRRRPTTEQKNIVSGLATDSSHKFNRGQLSAVLKAQTGTTLEPRQIGNIMNKARLEARQEVEKHGGDIHAIVESLNEKASREHGWKYRLKFDTNAVATGVWWQSPLQGELSRRYYDVLINDNTYNTNSAQYPLNIGVGIDSHGNSRNLWYCFQAIEDEDHHTWVFKCHLESTNGRPPDVLMSDRSRALISSAGKTLPTTEHFYCIQHLDGNVDQNLRRVIPADDWQPFKNGFWDAYRAVSPEEFEKKWKILTAHYPAAQKYLDEELYPCRRQWAWAYTSHKFTCGVRTNGRVEVENRITKVGGSKMSLKQVFDHLNERTNGQGVKELIQTRDSSRRQHASSIETIFPGPLALIREYGAPYAIHVCFEQMKQSVFYDVDFLQRPEGIRDWQEYAVSASTDHGYTWEKGEEKNMVNTFQNDNSHISTVFLLRLVRGRGLRIQHLVRVTHKGTRTLHIIALLQDGSYICDCCMGMNLGLPCRHFFAILSAMKTLKFSLGLIRPRWYKDNNLDIRTLPAVEAREAEFRRPEANLPAVQQTPLIASNPLEEKRHSPSNTAASEHAPPPPTQTVPARTVYHEANAALAPLINGIQTEEQLTDLLEQIQDLREARRRDAEREDFQEPLVHNPKGRPRTLRITGAIEGRPRGGGARATGTRTQTSNGRKCGACREEGHDRRNCPNYPPNNAD